MLRKYVPNLLTFANLAFGVLSILEVVEQRFILAAIFIMVAAFIDRYDGRVARFLDVSSDLGKELDSLADLISFGVAPAILVFMKFNFLELGKISALATCFLLLYIISGCYRLAKYNLSQFDGIFTGVPITVAGFILALYALAVPINTVSTMASVILLPFLAFFMVSKLRIRKI